MKPFIFGERNGIYIIDLGKTAKLFKEAEQFVSQLAAAGRTVLFVGTKRQAQDAVSEDATRCGMFYPGAESRAAAAGRAQRAAALQRISRLTRACGRSEGAGRECPGRQSNHSWG